MTEIKSTILLVFGRKGCGKTTYLRELIHKIEKKKPLLIIDMLDNFDVGIPVKQDNFHEIVNLLREKKNIRFVSNEKNAINAAIEMAYASGNYVIVCDESDLIFSNTMPTEIQTVLLRGRNRGIDFVLATLRPLKICVDARNNADTVICFALTSEDTLKTLCKEFGCDELHGKVSKLTKHDFIVFDVNNKKITKFYGKGGKYHGRDNG